MAEEIDRVPILLLGNLPPPYGGLPSYFAFILPMLLNSGFQPIVMVRQSEDYSEWQRMGVLVYRFPDTKAEQDREMRDTEISISALDLDQCLALGNRMNWIVGHERFLCDVHFVTKIAVRHGVKLIHTFHTYHRSVVALSVSRILHIPVALTVFGEVVSEYALKAELRPALSWFFEQFDAILATSEHCASGVELAGLSDRRVHVIPYGVDLDFFRPVDASALRSRLRLNEKRVILFQGRLSPEKGPQVLIDAMPQVLNSRPDTTVVLVGPDEGPNFEKSTGFARELRSEIARLRLDQHTLFVGSVPFDDLPAYYSLADLLVFPSTSPKECMGLSIKQAMACACPVIAARAGGACEAVVHGETGYCVEPNDPAALADSLGAALDSPNLHHLGDVGRARAATLFSTERTLRETLAIYRDMLA